MDDEEKKYLYNEKLVSRNKGLYLKKNVTKNQIIDYSMIEIKSPPIGIEAKFLSKIIGMTFNKNVSKKEPIKWEYLS